MNSVLAALLVCSLLCFYAQGQPVNRSSQCLCRNGMIRSPRGVRQLLKDPSHLTRVYKLSTFCPQMEIIIKTKNGSYCVDPESPAGRFVLLKKDQNVRSTSAITGLPPSSTQTRRQTTAQL